MNAFMTVFWFATGRRFGELTAEPNFIRHHNKLNEWAEELAL